MKVWCLHKPKQAHPEVFSRLCTKERVLFWLEELNDVPKYIVPEEALDIEILQAYAELSNLKFRNTAYSTQWIPITETLWKKLEKEKVEE